VEHPRPGQPRTHNSLPYLHFRMFHVEHSAAPDTGDDATPAAREPHGKPAARISGQLYRQMFHGRHSVRRPPQGQRRRGAGPLRRAVRMSGRAGPGNERSPDIRTARPGDVPRGTSTSRTTPHPQLPSPPPLPNVPRGTFRGTRHRDNPTPAALRAVKGGARYAPTVRGDSPRNRRQWSRRGSRRPGTALPGPPRKPGRPEIRTDTTTHDRPDARTSWPRERTQSGHPDAPHRKCSTWNIP